MREFGFKPWEIDELNMYEYAELISGWNAEQKQAKADAFKARTAPRRRW
jgi:hypothetical protein